MNAMLDEEIKVEVTDSLLSKPELYRIATAASDYFTSQLMAHAKVFGSNKTLTWQLQSNDIDGPCVAVGYNEDDEWGRRYITRYIRTEELVDPVRRDIEMLRLLQDALRQRWNRIEQNSREQELILKSEEDNGKSN